MLRRSAFVVWISLALCLGACTERRQGRLLELAEENIAAAKYPEAVDLLKKTVALGPDTRSAAKALYRLGFLLETYLRDFDGAIFYYTEFTKLSKDPTGLYEVQKRIANVYFEQNRDPEKAVVAFKKLLDLNPNSLEADLFLLRVGQAYFRQNNFDQARIEFQSLLDKFPKTPYAPRARFDIANSYYMEGKYDIAIQAFKQVGRLHPQSELLIEAQYLVAECLEEQGKLPEAIVEYEQLRGKYPIPEVIPLRIEEIKKRIKKVK